MKERVGDWDGRLPPIGGLQFNFFSLNRSCTFRFDLLGALGIYLLCNRWGQVRHLPEPLNWNWCFIGGDHVTAGCPANGTYQNGAFWATPLHYFVKAAQNVGESAVPGVLTLAQTVMSQTMDYFRGRAPGGGWQGVNECVDPPINYHGVDGYVASGTNVLEALSLLLNPTDNKPL